MPSCCIVGAGIAAAGAADALRGSDVDVTVLEKCRGVGGRTATRQRHGCAYDHGANYVTDAGDPTTGLVRQLGADGLVDVSEPVWTFDAEGDIAPGDGRDEHKWTWEAGVTQFARRLFARSDATVHTEVRVDGLVRQEATKRWTLTDADGEVYGPFDAVLLTPPAPQTADLLRTIAWNDAAHERLLEAAAAVTYRTVRSVVLHYEFSLDVPWYALVDTSKDHPVGWVSREECKPGHVPDGEGLLVVQMSPAWSNAHAGDPLTAVAGDVAHRVAELVGDDRLADYTWADDQGWRYALPESGVDEETTRAGEVGGLFVAGDWVAGEGRVHAALRSGQVAGERIRDSLAP